MCKYFTLHRCTFRYLTTAERFVFAYIEYFSRKSACCIRQSALAGKLGIGERTIKKAIAKLSDIGLVNVHANSAGQHKTLNQYTVNRKRFDAMKSGFTENFHEIRVDQETFAVFGATNEAILYSVMSALQGASEKRGENPESAINYLNQGYILYGQKQIADMCGCSARFVLDTLNQWQRDGLIDIEEIPLKWKTSRNAYLLKSTIEDFARVKKVPLQNSKGEKSAPINTNEGEKSAPTKQTKVNFVPPYERKDSDRKDSLNEDVPDEIRHISHSERSLSSERPCVENFDFESEKRKETSARILAQQHRIALISGKDINGQNDNRKTTDAELRAIQNEKRHKPDADGQNADGQNDEIIWDDDAQCYVYAKNQIPERNNSESESIMDVFRDGDDVPF